MHKNQNLRSSLNYAWDGKRKREENVGTRATNVVGPILVCFYILKTAVVAARAINTHVWVRRYFDILCVKSGKLILSTSPSLPTVSCSHIHARADCRCGAPRLENRNKLQKIQFARKRVFCRTRTDIRVYRLSSRVHRVCPASLAREKTRLIYILITRRTRVTERGVCLVAANYPRTACGSRWLRAERRKGGILSVSNV